MPPSPLPSPDIFTTPRASRNAVPIIVHSHLSWDNVWQRPQQYLSRLASDHPVLFIEFETRDCRRAFYEFRPAAGAKNVVQLKTVFPGKSLADPDFVDQERRRLVKAALKEPKLRKFSEPIQWFYDPMAVPAFMGRMDERLTVYDCMDELSQFRGAPRDLIQRERQLLVNADVLFCGGYKLYRAKRLFNENCHFYSCGVDTQHFAKARAEATPIAADIAHLPRPIFGYYGVVDERLDYELISQLAQNTSGSVVIIGPTAKVEASDLPKAANLHWLGRREYQDLPGYSKGLDVCIMPFAKNESTEYINPTKALEYLAAGRPVVSTEISDVVSLFSRTVDIAKSTAEFITLCQARAAHPSKARQRAGLRQAEENTWEHHTAEIKAHMECALERKASPPKPSIRSSARQVAKIS